jgi:hypothetical protein
MDERPDRAPGRGGRAGAARRPPGRVLIGDSSGKGATTVISNATKENHTVTVTQPPSTVTVTQSETTATTVTETEPAT